MIGFILSLFGRFWKPLVAGAVIILIFGWVHFAIERRVARKIAARDAFWRAAIETSNKAVEAEQTRAAIDAANRSRAAEAEITALRDTLIDLEKINASLPKGDGCGLDTGRARLLNR